MESGGFPPRRNTISTCVGITRAGTGGSQLRRRQQPLLPSVASMRYRSQLWLPEVEDDSPAASRWSMSPHSTDNDSSSVGGSPDSYHEYFSVNYHTSSDRVSPAHYSPEYSVDNVLPSPNLWSPLTPDSSDSALSPSSIISRSLSGSDRDSLSAIYSDGGCEVKRGQINSQNGKDYRGQICLKVTYWSQMLTVHVQSARHLKKSQLSRNGSNPDTFITVNVKQPHSHHVLQGSTGCTPYSSRVHRDCSCPEYNEKLTFETDDVIPGSRIVISVWKHGDFTLVGRTSFGIHNIIHGRNTVNGWYFLLDETIGMCKHLKVIEVCDKQESHVTKHCAEHVISVKKYSLEPHGLTIRKVYDIDDKQLPISYRIANIDKNSCSYYYGLRKNDVILSIDGYSTRTMVLEEINDFISDTFENVTLTVRRIKDRQTLASQVHRESSRTFHSLHKSKLKRSLKREDSSCSDSLSNSDATFVRHDSTRNSSMRKYSGAKFCNKIIRSLTSYQLR